MITDRDIDGASQVRRRPSQDPFECYLEDALGRFYQEVLEAPLPPEIASLAERLEARIRSSNGDAGDRAE